VSSAVVCGLIAAVGWGIADWLARGIGMALGTFRAQLWSQAIGIVVLGVAVVVSGAGIDAFAAGTPRAWAFAGLYACLIGTASLLFFEAFGKGAVAVVAPIVGAYGAVTVAWSVVFGVEPTPQVLTGLAVVLAGVIAASVPARGTSTPGQQRGTIAALVAAFLFGTAFFVLGKEIVPTLGSLVPAFLSRLVSPVLLGAGALALKVSLAPPPRSLWPTMIAATALSSIATVVTGMGSQDGDSSVVAVLGSLSVVVTVLIATVVLREKLALHQRLGVVVAVVGIPLLAL